MNLVPETGERPRGSGSTAISRAARCGPMSPAPTPKCRSDAALHLDDAAPAELSHHHASDGAKPLVWCSPEPGGLGPLPPHVLVTAAEPHSLAIVLERPLRPPSALRA